MNAQGGGTPPGSHRGRFVLLAALITSSAALLFIVPLIGPVGLPALLLVLLFEREEESMRRYLPLVWGAAVVAILWQWVVLFPVALALSAVALDQGVRHRWDWRLTSAGAAVPQLVAFAVPMLMLGQEGIRASYIDSLQRIAPLLGNTDPAAMVEQMGPWLDFVLRLLPAFITLSVVAHGILALALGGWLLRRKGLLELTPVPEFAMWALPDWMVWPTAASILLAVTTRGAVQTVAINAAVVQGALYSLHGLAVFWYGFVTRALPNWARAAFLIVVVFFPPAQIALVLAGMLETWIPLRSIMAASQESNEKDEEEM